MRAFGCRLLSVMLLIVGTQTVAPQSRAADPEFAGSKKLVVVQPFIEVDLMIVDLKDEGGKLSGTVVSALPISQDPLKIAAITKKADELSFAITSGGLELRFTGKPGKDGGIYGILAAQGANLPARLMPTKETKINPVDQKVAQSAQQPFAQAMQNEDVKTAQSCVYRSSRGPRGKPDDERGLREGSGRRREIRARGG